MKNKVGKIIVLNIAIILGALLVSEFIALSSYKAKYKGLIEAQANLFGNPREFIKQNSPHYSFPVKFDYNQIDEKVKTKVYKAKNSKKRPVVTIGCSYTEGNGLDENQTFAYKLNKLTNRTTYNRGVSGSGPQLVYRQLSDENFKKEIPDAEYVIYTFIHNHLHRQFQTLFCPYTSDINLKYTLENGNLTETSSPFWFMYWSFLVKTYLEWKIVPQFENEIKNNYQLFNKILQSSVDEMHKKYPNSKFVLVEFPQSSLCIPKDGFEEDIKKYEEELTEEQIKKIEEMGIIYINASKLAGHKFCDKRYRLPDGDHPSEVAWDELTPKIVKKLGL